MAKACSICIHPERHAIEKALLDARAGFRNLANHFGVSTSALFRHRKLHLPELIARGLEDRPLAGSVAGPREDPATEEHTLEIVQHHETMNAHRDRQAIDAVQQLKAINGVCLEVLRKAREDGKHGVLLRAVDRIARQIELQAKLLGEIQEGSTVNIAVLPQWHAIRQTVLEALQPYPEARMAVVRALKGAD